jgi:hypothetical protein
LKIKNFPEVSKTCGETLDKIRNIVKQTKGSIYKADNFLMPIFSSANTRTMANQIISVNVAREIDSVLKVQFVEVADLASKNNLIF